MFHIRFQDTDYLLIGDLITGGAIATREQYKHGVCSFAHLFEDGVIRRFYTPIGTKEDITVLGETEQDFEDDAFWNTLVHPSWNRE